MRLSVPAAALLLSACQTMGDYLDDLNEPPIPEVAGLVTVAERYSTERDLQARRELK